MSRPLFSPRLMLPLTILTGVLVIGAHIGDLWDTASSGALFARAHAETKPDAPKDAAPKPTEAAPPPAAATSTLPDMPKLESPPPVDLTDDSNAQMELLKQLSDRRAQLDKRAAELDQREALAKIAEQRIDQKNREMETLRQQLQSMVSQIQDTQSAQTENLVKIYETMKPNEAAKIFETLDMPVLLGVIQRMKPARTAPILAEMAPEKARDITVALTKQDQLPKIK